MLDLTDFTIHVPEDKAPVVLQLTDTQIIDASKARSENRLDGNEEKEYWRSDKRDARCYGYLREIIENVKPDFIFLTGDVVYGEFDDDGERFTEFIEFMEGFEIPWAPVFGNHDNESHMGGDWQCSLLEKAKNCLFLQRKLTGNGNYTVGIKQGDRLTRVFFLLDSNGCGCASAESIANGHTKTAPGFGKDQIAWYTDAVKRISAHSPETKLSFAFHIQLSVFGKAFEKYRTDGKTQVTIDKIKDKDPRDFGFIGATMKTPWDSNYEVWNSLKTLGVDSIFVGHEHANSASIIYDGVRLQYGMKSSSYDRLNYIDAYGNIECTYYSAEKPLVGGSYFKLAADGSITEPTIYYCHDTKNI